MILNNSDKEFQNPASDIIDIAWEYVDVFKSFDELAKHAIINYAIQDLIYDHK